MVVPNRARNKCCLLGEAEMKISSFIGIAVKAPTYGHKRLIFKCRYDNTQIERAGILGLLGALSVSFPDIAWIIAVALGILAVQAWSQNGYRPNASRSDAS